ncbi:MAG: fluoride efflux transporter CrcB [Saprospiraceae bacterium]
MHSWIYVFLGGGAGSLFRFGIGNYFTNVNTNFPAGTFVANLMACFLLGLLMGIDTKGELQHHHSLLLATGFCGGFSTFSTFSNDTLKLFQNNQVALGLFYIAISFLGGLVAVYLGYKVQSSM